MANELLSALENRVNSAVDTIEGLRSEVKQLKAERQLLEDKMRELLEKMGVVENGAEADAIINEIQAEGQGAEGANGSAESTESTGIGGQASQPYGGSSFGSSYGFGGGHREY